MEFGILIDPVYEPEQLIMIAKSIEDWGFSSFWYPDEKFFRDCYVGLTLVGHHTQRINIGTCVTDPYARHPILTATAIGTLAELAPGRTWLGLGAGGRGFNAMGIDRQKPAVALREAAGIIRRLLAGEMVDFQGEIIQLKERRLDFEPSGDVKLMIATGHGPQIQRLAGEIGDAVMLANYATPAVIEKGINRVRQGAECAGRTLLDFRLISRVDVAVHHDQHRARDAVAPMILSNFRSSFPSLSYLDDLPPFELSSKFLDLLKRKDYETRTYYRFASRAAPLIPQVLTENMSITGDPKEVRRRMEAIIEMNVFNEITIHPISCEGQSIMESLSLISELIGPLLD